MNFREFLPLAEELIVRNSEAAWRTAVSRAYYAAFHVACDFMRALGFAVPKADRAHGYLWLRLQNCGNSDIAQAGQSLKDLRTHRNRADYEARQTMTQPDAEKYVVDAKAIVAALDKRPDKIILRQITEAIKKYERDVLKEVTWR